MTAWTRVDDGIAIAVRVTARGNRDEFGAGSPAHFAVRLAAAPVDGAANAALILLVARTFGVSKSAVTLVAGQTARLKRVRITGDTTTLAKIAASHYAVAP